MLLVTGYFYRGNNIAPSDSGFDISLRQKYFIIIQMMLLQSYNRTFISRNKIAWGYEHDEFSPT